jgi:hypothetical protein
VAVAESPRAFEYATFPILPLRKTPGTESGVSGNPDYQGTAVMLTPDGLFMTARHCVNVAFGEKDIVGDNAYSIEDYGLLIHQKQRRIFDLRKVISLSAHPEYDVAIGVAEVPIPGQSNFPMTLGLDECIGRGGFGARTGLPRHAVESLGGRCARG